MSEEVKEVIAKDIATEQAAKKPQEEVDNLGVDMNKILVDFMAKHGKVKDAVVLLSVDTSDGNLSTALVTQLRGNSAPDIVDYIKRINWLFCSTWSVLLNRVLEAATPKPKPLPVVPDLSVVKPSNIEEAPVNGDVVESQGVIKPLVQDPGKNTREPVEQEEVREAQPNPAAANEPARRDPSCYDDTKTEPKKNNSTETPNDKIQMDTIQCNTCGKECPIGAEWCPGCSSELV